MRARAHPRMRGSRLTALICAAVLTLTGCTNEPGKEQPVNAMSEADVTRQVHQYAEQVTAMVGNTSLTNQAESSAGCTGQGGEQSDQIFYVQGAYQLPVPADQHLNTLARIRDRWRELNYTITEDRTFPDGKTGVLKATTPTDKYSIKLESTSPPQALALLVHSACYRSPTPR